MVLLWHPLQFLLVALAGWINQQQRDVIDYSAGGEPHSTGAAWTSSAPILRRSAHPTGRKSQNARSTCTDGDQVHRDTGHLAGRHRALIARKYDGRLRRGAAVFQSGAVKQASTGLASFGSR